MKQQFNSLLDIVKRFPSEKSCRDYLSQARWNGKPVCYHCGYSEKIYKINDGALYKCAKCRRQFTVRLGTIFEDSALPLQKWFMAIYLLTAHKKGISSVQLAKDIQVTQKTAWFMMHRIRYAVRTAEFSKPLDGFIEMDETYVGGKTTHAESHTPKQDKAVVFGMAQRNGDVRASFTPDGKRNTLFPIIKRNVSPKSIVFTDENHVYHTLDKLVRLHETVDHSKHEYARGMIHTNTIESFWSLLKRGVYGIYHHVSKKHLDKYIDEFEFRFNSRKLTDTERFRMMLDFCGARLTYDQLKSMKYA